MTDVSNQFLSDDDSEAMEALTCSSCGTPYRHGELACPKCGKLFGSSGTTHRLKIRAKDSTQTMSQMRGEAFVSNPKALTVEIEGTDLTLPIGENVVVGRATNIPGQAQPDVDLSDFGAEEKGVSRCHVRIRYRDILTYVMDLDSSNGTLLNGRRLMPQNERLLRSGDELQLGQLRVRAKF